MKWHNYAGFTLKSIFKSTMCTYNKIIEKLPCMDQNNKDE